MDKSMVKSETVVAPPPPVDLTAKVIGWCTYNRCYQGSTSWEKHVQHQRKRHCTAAERHALCRFCLELHHAGLQEHLQEHALSDVACSLCSGRFLDDGDVARHKADFHQVTTGDEVPPALGRCTKCPATFSSWEDNVQHQVIRHHKKDADRVCSHCLVPLPSVEFAETHVLRHSEGKDFPCHLCPARLTSEETRTKHLQRFHAQEWAFR
ncbi:zinc finger protein PLAGL2-like isoform X2 [Thrips palmi]|nr:zinc finger protein PLAGL2-like isoform X2 [Thrips palmi]XP_034254829.1 zinc finger protein PLAGL2-like isoform X2 [Thrips palmi]XP_034254830.1 zinc finger protein PLAGL2-like isoform X2 [Thrips palmi]XP_034254831.1 zinc finger protein PLAGL2-like isoform X2 [Thrips palmi]XP_034254833.1 zinc finger protein PLAGL2-like isoform X2 [Thrips palmi]